MNLFSLFFDNDFFQRVDINRLDERAAGIQRRMERTSDKAQTLDKDVKELRRDIARLALVVETLSRALIVKGVCSREEFMTLLQDVDAEDGSVDGFRSSTDGKAPGPVCPACRHSLPAGALKCQYCGAALGT